MSLPKHIAKPDPNIYLKSENFLVIDFETSNKNKGDPQDEENSIVLAIWYDNNNKKTNIKWGNEYGLAELVDACEQADFIVCHNTKFELGWLVRCGIDLTKVLPYCTLLGHWVYLGNRQGKKDLNTVAAHYGLGAKGDVVSLLIKNSVCPSDIPKKWLEEYCIQDVELTLQIFLKQRTELEELGLLHLVYTRNIFTPVLVDMEKNGMYLDPARVKATKDEYYAEYRTLRDELDEISGGINRGSPKQLAEFLYERMGFNQPKDFRGNPIVTATGKPSTSKDTLGKLKASNKRQRRFLELYLKEAKLDDALTKYLNKFQTCCEEDGCILQGSLNQARTATHRLASTGKKYKIQFQNFDRNFKKIFRARHNGWLIGEIDGSQLEFRVAGHLGEDIKIISDIREGVDVHSFTAQTLTDAGQETDRQGGKPHTFKPLYGGQSGTKAEQAYYAAFKAKYPGITQAQQDWITEVLREGYLTTEYGMRFYWPDTKMTQSGYVINSTSICNYPVQGFATAEIIPIAITYQWHRMKAAQMESFLVNTIHDSSIAEINPNEIELYKELSVKAYSLDVYNYLQEVYHIQFKAPLGTEIVLTPHWADKEELEADLGFSEKFESTPIGELIWDKQQVS